MGNIKLLYGGELIPIQRWKRSVEMDMFNCFDGSGYYCTETEETDEPVDFSIRAIDKIIDKGKYKYIAWYNK